MNVKCICAFLTAMLAGLCLAAFAPGERVVFFGDSITHGGWYEAYLQLFENLRRPGCGTRIMNGGIAGETALRGCERLDHDILACRPDRVFIMFGMNDVGRDLYKMVEPADEKEASARQQRLATYRAKMESLVSRLVATNVTTVVMTPSPYDQYAQIERPNLAGCNEPGLATCAEIARDLARTRRLDLIELHRPLTASFKAHPTEGFCHDRVHPNAAGHLLMAAEILEQMSVSPLVARVSVDAKGGQALAERATVSEVEVASDGLSFTYAPQALPFPKTQEYEIVAQRHPLTERLNREEIQVANLASGRYELAFDGQIVGSFTDEELRKGVNVALLPTPNQRRAAELALQVVRLQRIVSLRRDLEANRLRVRRMGVDTTDIAATQAALDKWLAECEAAKSRSLPYYRLCVKNNRTWASRESELIAEEEAIRASFNAVRPAVSRVTVKRIDSVL